MGQKRLKRGKERQTCQSKKQHDKERAMRQAEKLKDDKKATMTQGINLALIVLVSALPVLFEKAFLIAMKAEAKTI